MRVYFGGLRPQEMKKAVAKEISGSAWQGKQVMCDVEDPNGAIIAHSLSLSTFNQLMDALDRDIKIRAEIMAT